EQGDLEIANQDRAQQQRIRTLMVKYRDRPMDLADASLVALAEERQLDQVFTLDRSDFTIYRIHGRRPFRIQPA
ncbi:MAG: hypothetical protein ACE5O2_12795, partial [Armatimonadota bacterium]